MSRKNLIKKTIIALSIITLSAFVALISHKGIAGEPKKFIRLHIIAESDNPQDQTLKLKVRDKILEALDKDFETIDDARNYIEKHLKDLENIAQQEVLENGKNYTTKALFGKFHFPPKKYGYITLPAGEYEALRIIIGSGSGANWWCVIFPPLCFVDIACEKPPEEIDLDDIPIEIRFKFLELWQEAKTKITNTIKLAFP